MSETHKRTQIFHVINAAFFLKIGIWQPGFATAIE
jgi:hypothetical protein